jgi:protein-L-isoaspartate(D-aspartate) O-methyltransferase
MMRRSPAAGLGDGDRSGRDAGAHARGFDPYGVARRRMVEEQLTSRGIRDPRVLDAMASVPRHAFLDAALWPRAYADCALPTVEGQTISQPYIVAHMLELALLQPDHRVLEIGTGSGYVTALLARLVERVFSVERVATLLRAAQRRLDELGVRNLALRHGDGSLGWQEFAPYARVLVSAAAPRVPDALRAQLDVGGVLVIPVGGPQLQHLEVWHRLEPDRWQHQRRGECRFVPLLGHDAWRSEPEAT